jgi:hypothetical protein
VKPIPFVRSDAVDRLASGWGKSNEDLRAEPDSSLATNQNAGCEPSFRFAGVVQEAAR